MPGTSKIIVTEYSLFLLGSSRVDVNPVAEIPRIPVQAGSFVDLPTRK